MDEEDVAHGKTWSMCIDTMKYDSAIKKETMPFVATWVDLEVIELSEVRKRQMWHRLYEESKNWYKWTYETETDSDSANKGMVATGERSAGEGMHLGIETGAHSTTQKIENQQGPPAARGTLLSDL